MRKGGQAPEDGDELNGSRLVRDAPVATVDAFLGLFKNHPGSFATEREPVRRYIDVRAGGELSKWDVLFAGVRRRTANSLVDTRLGFPLVCQRRAPGKRSDNSMLMVTSKQRVSSRGITRVGPHGRGGLGWQRRSTTRGGRNPGAVGTIRTGYMAGFGGKPLLVIHLLAIGKEGEDLSCTSPVAAWSISFPGTRLAETKVEYVVNTTWYHEHFGDDDSDDEFDEDEE